MVHIINPAVLIFLIIGVSATITTLACLRMTYRHELAKLRLQAEKDDRAAVWQQDSRRSIG